MLKTTKEPADIGSLTYSNPEHDLPRDLADAFSSRHRKHLEMLSFQDQSDLTPELRRKVTDSRNKAYRDAAKSMGLDFDKVSSNISGIFAEKNDMVAETLTNRSDRWNDYVEQSPPIVPDAEPALRDSSFWWARTDAFVAPDTRAEFRTDGLHFRGGPKVHNHNGEMHTRFGAIASFGLNPARFPASPSGWFESKPFVELFGGVLAYAPNWDLLQGDGIASCQLFLRQTIFQWGFGPSGSVPVTVAQAAVNDPWRIYLKNTGYSRRAGMPGFKPLPPVRFHRNQFNNNQDLWAQIEVRLDIYLNCAGALVWCDPNVLLRSFQWPLTAG